MPHRYQDYNRLESDGGFQNLDYLSQSSWSGNERYKHSSVGSIGGKFNLPPDPNTWGSAVSRDQHEPDDLLHDSSQERWDTNFFSGRGLVNVGCLLVLISMLLALFVGYPIVSYTQKVVLPTVGVNATGQVPQMIGGWGMIDDDTPRDAHTYKSIEDGRELHLVFSDEFNVDGRTFYPGDDPYWEAVDLHYWQTNNLEWYDPEAVTTENGALKVTLSRKSTHGLNYEGGMIQTWNKFCFTGGLVVASVVLPGFSNVAGLWPAIWSMGNLGRAGYGASLDGTWPYSYDACDVGTLKNQTLNGEPHLATVYGDEEFGGVLSYAPGQKLSRCTCEGESHPGPKHSDGSYVGRSAPEIDMFEAQAGTNFDTDGTGTLQGEVSQSGQFAPFNYKYEWIENANTRMVHDPSFTVENGYKGGVYQQATSFVTKTNPDCYSMESGCSSVYGFEYKPGYNEGYIAWMANDRPTWTIKGGGLAADENVKISARPVSQEPMYLLINLGISENFGDIDFAHLQFPVSMLVDYIRVYQDPKAMNVGCDPEDFPTADYIMKYQEAYTNPNLTTWVDDYKQTLPKNRLIDTC
ncbi:concanavalin A-like lectin/glucanase [Marasmius fiardii PR-910]|nr:concanavalin A-like lectin/glucanase [Marasmius fiardii PR-910]